MWGCRNKPWIRRNKFIVRVLEKEIERHTRWSDGFFEQLAQVESGDAEAVDEMIKAIRTSRISKGPANL